MTMLIVILHVFVCLFLVVVILLQAGRGQGLSWGVFGGTPQSILGTRTTSFFARLTSACAIIFLITCILLNIIETRKSRSLLAGPRAAASNIDLNKLKQALKEADAKAKTQAGAATVPATQGVKSETPPTPVTAVPITKPASDLSQTAANNTVAQETPAPAK